MVDKNESVESTDFIEELVGTDEVDNIPEKDLAYDSQGTPVGPQEDAGTETDTAKADTGQEAERQEQEQKQEQEQVKPTSKFVKPDPKGDAESDDETQTESNVPVHVVAKLRADKRALKEENERLRSTRPAGGKAEDAEGDPLAGMKDDEFIEAGQVRQVINSEIAKAVGGVRDEIAAGKQKEIAQQADSAVLNNEEVFRKDHADYDQVVDDAVDLGYLSDADYDKALKTKDPAASIYATAQRKFGAAKRVFGIDSPGKQSAGGYVPPEKDDETLGEDAEKSEEEFFTSVFPT